jgi:hypothetical protein
MLHYPVLIVGFNRVDFLMRRIDEILKSVPIEVEIFVVIDGPRLGSSDNLDIQKIKDFLIDIREQREVFAIFRETNLGCDANIILSVSEILATSEAVIIVEDDVSVSKGFYRSINELLNETINKPDIGAVSGFSPYSNKLSKYRLGIRNSWRISNYYCAWGTAITRNSWDSFEVVTDQEHIRTILKNSSTWNSLSSRKQRVWCSRFSRGNYDFQMQLNLFRREQKVIYPYFRLVENVGFNDRRSTHTKGDKPKAFLGSGFATQEELAPKISSSSLQNYFWRIIDSNAWAGDGILSTRGREVGIRTIIKLLAKKIRNILFN